MNNTVLIYKILENLTFSEISELLEYLKKKKNNNIDDTLIYIEDFPKLSSDVSDSERIQRAINSAGIKLNSSNQVGGSIYYSNKIKILFAPFVVYKIHQPIKLIKGVEIDCYGECRIEATNPNKSINFLNGVNVSGRLSISNINPIGFNKAFEVSTGDVDMSMIEINNCHFHYCNVGIDTVGFKDSRSTLITINKCSFYKTDLAVTNYCDKMTINNSWFYHSGYAGCAISNNNNLIIDKCVFVPVLSEEDCRWIDNRNNSSDENMLVLRGSRFGGEGGGGIPIVYNYVSYVKNSTNRHNKIINIDSCTLCSAHRNIGIIKLFAIPNKINIKNCFGMFNNTNGLIVADDSLDLSIITDSDKKHISIEYDDMFYQDAYAIVDSNLQQFIKG